jgi:hypothetical protein
MNSFEWGILIAGSVVFAYLFADILGYMTITVSTFLAATLIACLMMGEFTLMTLRHNTPKLIAHNFHTTTDGNCIDAGHEAIFTMGDIDYGIKIKGTEGVVIMPSDSVNVLGTQLVTTGVPYLKDFDELSPLVREKLIEHGLIKGPFYECQASARQLQDPKTADKTILETRYKKFSNDLIDINKSKFGSVEEVNEVAGRIGNKKSEGFSFRKYAPKDQEEQDK